MKKQTRILHTALCHTQQAQAPATLSHALCFEMPEGELPEWVQLLPVGNVVGRDGRTWQNPNPEDVIGRTQSTGRDVVLDWEHATEFKAPKGEPAPAAAWFSDYKIADGFIWGKPDFTPAGKKSVLNREQRYISPVFRYTKDGLVWDITSAALTNRHNLFLQALNHEQPTQKTHEDTHMKLTPEEMQKLLAKMGLADDCSFDTALNHIQEQQTQLQTALNHAQTPPLDKFVPRGDYDAALARAANAEQALADKNQAEKDSAIAAAVDGAIEQGKVAPSSKAFYVAACQQEGGLENFKAFVASAPVITQASQLDGKDPKAPQTAMNTEEKQLADMFGNSADDLAKYA